MPAYANDSCASVDHDYIIGEGLPDAVVSACNVGIVVVAVVIASDVVGNIARYSKSIVGVDVEMPIAKVNAGKANLRSVEEFMSHIS